LSLFLDILVSLQAVFVFFFAGYEYLTLWDFPSLPSATHSNPSFPKVSIVLPVRNQATTIVECMDSLVNIDYPNKEIIVVEGRSSDGTQDLLRKYLGLIRVIEEDPLPHGWVGKNWACHLGYKQITGELLLFTDGDSIPRLALSGTLAPGARRLAFGKESYDWERANGFPNNGAGESRAPANPSDNSIALCGWMRGLVSAPRRNREVR